MLTLELLGTLSLRDETPPVPVAAQQKRPLGLLAILGLGGKPGLSRDRIEAYLWPESSGARAQHALDQTVYAIRHARSEEHTSELQSRLHLVCRLLLEKKKLRAALCQRYFARGPGELPGGRRARPH